MAKIVYRQMPAPGEQSQQISAPRAKVRMQKPQGGGKYLVQIPGGARGMVMDEIDTCIMLINCFKILALVNPHLIICHIVSLDKIL